MYILNKHVNIEKAQYRLLEKTYLHRRYGHLLNLFADYSKLIINYFIGNIKLTKGQHFVNLGVILKFVI